MTFPGAPKSAFLGGVNSMAKSQPKTAKRREQKAPKPEKVTKENRYFRAIKVIVANLSLTSPIRALRGT